MDIPVESPTFLESKENMVDLAAQPKGTKDENLRQSSKAS